MVPLDHVLAVAVLVSPGDPGPIPEHAGLARPLQAISLAWELLDPREASVVLMRPTDFSGDVELVRRRYDELVDAPPVHDAARFSSRDLTCELLTFNRAYHSHLMRRSEALGPNQREVEEALQEADQLYRAWDLLRDARSECYYISARRQALAGLRDAIGQADYYRGVMPPHVPVWRFAWRD